MFFIWKSVVVGGIETLIYRVASSLNDRGEASAVICNTISDKMQIMYDKANINIILIQQWNPYSIAEVIKNTKAIVFTFSDFFIISHALYKIKSCNNLRCYIAHPHFSYVGSSRFAIIDKIMRDSIKKIIDDHVYSRLVFMDELCYNTFDNYYHIRKKDKYIVRLPINTTNKTIQHRTNHNNCINILTIARADFPFKGYLLGLLKSLDEIDSSYHINFTIISYGKDFDALMKCYNSVVIPNHISINIVGETPYTELDKFYTNNDLYIGMGTTLIEAASRSMVCISVQCYTDKLLSNGYFHNDPYSLGCDDSYKTISGTYYINKYLRSSASERNKMHDMSYSSFYKNYSVDNFIYHVVEKELDKININLPVWAEIGLSKRAFGVFFSHNDK